MSSEALEHSDGKAEWEDDLRYYIDLWPGAPADEYATVVAALDALLAALAVAREREQRLRDKIEHVIADSPGTPATVKQFLRAALVDEPAAATLAEPESTQDIAARDDPSGSASAAANALIGKERPPEAVFDQFRELYGLPTSSGSASAAADEPGETPA